MASVRPPPAEVPKIAVLRGSAVRSISRHTATASSSAAGNGWSGGIR
jgi:hypothetical protein